MDAVAAELATLGFQMRPDWLHQCWSHLHRECGASFERLPRGEQFALVYEQALFSNFHAAASGKLPAGVDGTHDTWIPGPIVLQVDELVNISDSAEHRTDSSQGARMLKLSLTDGKQQVFGIEFRPLPELGVDTPAGTKVAVARAWVLRGLLLLVPENVRVLGGQVDALRAHQVRILQQQTREARARQRAAGLDPDQASITADGEAGEAVGDTPQPPPRTGHIPVGGSTATAASSVAVAPPAGAVAAAPAAASRSQPSSRAAEPVPPQAAARAARAGGAVVASARAGPVAAAPAGSPPSRHTTSEHPVTPIPGARRVRAGVVASGSALALVVPAGPQHASTAPGGDGNHTIPTEFATHLGGRRIVGMGVAPGGVDAAASPVVPLEAAAAPGLPRAVWCQCHFLAYTQFNLRQARVHVRLVGGSCRAVAALAVGVCEQLLGMPLEQIKETGRRFKHMKSLAKAGQLPAAEQQAKTVMFQSINCATAKLEGKAALCLVAPVNGAEASGIAAVTPLKSKGKDSAQDAAPKPTLVVHMVAAVNGRV